MKKMSCPIAAAFLASMAFVLFAATPSVQAGKSVHVTDFSGWVSDPWGSGTPVAFTLGTGKVTLKATGAAGETWGGIYDDIEQTSGKSIGTGMKATINVSKVAGNAQAGICTSLGMIGNQRIQAQMFYESNTSSQSRIRWRIRSKDTTVSGASWSVLATGVFGDLWTSGYSTGTKFTVTFQRVGNEIWLSLDGTSYTVKWTPSSTMTGICWHPEIFGWAANGSNSITAAVQGVYLLY